MADAKKVKIGGIWYYVKDETARNGLVAKQDKLTFPLSTNQGGTGGIDSGWKSLTNESVFTGNIFYRKVGKFVEIISNNIRLVETLTGATIVLGYLPDGYRTSKDLNIFAGHPLVSGGGIGMLNVFTSGKLTFVKPSTISSWGTNAYILFSSMFLI